MMEETITLKKILELENDPEILNFRCKKTNYLIWPLVRQEFLRCIITDLIYKTSPWFTTTITRDYTKILTGLGRSVFHNTFNRIEKNNTILIMASGDGLIKKNNLTFNRLSDYFAQCLESDTIVLEDLFHWSYPSSRANNKILYTAPYNFSIAFKTRVNYNLRDINQASQLVEWLKNRAQKTLGWDLNEERTAFFINFIAYKTAQITIKRNFYQKLLQKHSTKLVLKEEGCYGHSSIFNRTAREMGIVVAEYQHGTISLGHDAYNSAPTLTESQSYRYSLPEYFLSYGDWWSKQIQLPIKKITIGNPHRSEMLKLRKKPKLKKLSVLLIGDGVETKLHLALALAIANHLNSDWIVSFRPHPLEKESLKKITFSEFSKVLIDTNENIYDSFFEASVVLGEVSTALFEAVGLVSNVFIWDTPKARFYYPEYPFPKFTGISDLIPKLIKLKEGSVSDVEDELIWASNWQNNYLQFVKSFV